MQLPDRRYRLRPDPSPLPYRHPNARCVDSPLLYTRHRERRHGSRVGPPVPPPVQKGL